MKVYLIVNAKGDVKDEDFIYLASINKPLLIKKFADIQRPLFKNLFKDLPDDKILKTCEDAGEFLLIEKKLD